MTSETFRQERRTSQDNQSSLDSIHAFQKAAGVNVPSPMQEQMPQQLKDLIDKQSPQTNFTMHSNTNESQAISNMVGGSKLEGLIAGLRKFTHKYEQIILPSLGKFYDGNDGPVDGILHIRPMTGDEEDILANNRITRHGSALKEIFKKCIQEKYNTDNFLVEDNYYILIYLRAISFGTTYEAEITCPNCNERFPTNIDLDQDMELTRCPDNFDKSNLNDKLPVTGYNYSYRFARVADSNTINNYKNRQVKNFGLDANTGDLTFNMSLYVEDIEGVNDQKSLHTLLKNLPVNDLNHIRDTVTAPPFGVNTEIRLDCPICISDIKTNVPMGLNFFFPKAKRTGTQA